MRRAHGAEAALLAARSAVLAGFSATATVEAGRRYGLPLAGTMAHSYVQSFEDEMEAFRHYARTFPHGATLLIDTYDTARAARRVIDLLREGIPIAAVRIDSGDLAQEARTVRGILDSAHASGVKIVVSGNLDEYAIESLVAGGAPIDAFGVGTRLDTASDAPTLDAVYKLESYDGRPTRKRSPGKETWPGAKQIWRTYDSSGKILADRITTATEKVEGAQPLLVPVMRNGQRIGPAPTFSSSIAHAQSNLAQLPLSAMRLEHPMPWEPIIDGSLRALVAELDGRPD
jgi:nicotinate phosphoribosyltransferase